MSPRAPRPSRPTDHARAQVGAVALAVAVTIAAVGCATPQPAAPEAPRAAVPFALPPDPGSVVNRDDEFVLVVARDGDTYAALAQRYLGDAGKAWWIAQANGGEPLRIGTIAVIPLKVHNVAGVYASGYQTVPVLCYHRFGARGSKLTVTPAEFEAQMEYLARNGYHVVTLARLARFLEGKEALPSKSVAITIDDGYRSTYEIAYPILRKFGFPATVFLYTDFVGAADALTWQQMKELEASGLIDIQPHSKTHANLTLRLPGENDARYRDRIRREVDVPVTVIRERFGSPVFTFAYPYGDVNETAVELLARQGVRQGLTVTSGGNAFFAYPYMLRRTMVFGHEDLDAFRAKLATFARNGSR